MDILLVGDVISMNIGVGFSDRSCKMGRRKIEALRKASIFPLPTQIRHLGKVFE